MDSTINTANTAESVQTFEAYGLKFCSALPLSAFSPAEFSPASADVVISLEDPCRLPPGIPTTEGYTRFGPTQAVLTVANLAVFLLYQGDRIVVVPLQSPPTEDLIAYLCGIVTGVLLYQRGWLVLHASSVEVDGHAVAFMGESRAGKSTLATALEAEGYPLIADDVTALNLTSDRMEVYPGSRQLKLDPEMAHLLDYPSGAFVYTEERKSVFQWNRRTLTASMPLHSIYYLSSERRSTPTIEPIPVQEAIEILLRQSFPTRLLASLERIPLQHFVQCSHVARQLPVYRVQRSEGLSQVKAFVRTIQGHIQSQSFPPSAAPSP